MAVMEYIENVTKLIRDFLYKMFKVTGVGTVYSKMQSLLSNPFNEPFRPMFLPKYDIQVIGENNSLAKQRGIGIGRVLYTYITSFIKYASPAIALHGLVLILAKVNGYVGNEELSAMYGLDNQIVMLYVVLGGLGIIRGRDYLTLYRGIEIAKNNEVNQDALMHFDGFSFIQDSDYRAANRKRKRINKYLLFPTPMELHVGFKVHDMTKKLAKKHRYHLNARGRNRIPQNHHESMHMIEALSMKARIKEHHAAKELADERQELYGGINEYDLMVARYSHRTTPTMRRVIRDVQNDM